MTTPLHAAIVELFRRDPELAAYLLATSLGETVPEHARSRVLDAAVIQVAATELRADLVIAFDPALGERPLLEIVLEAQTTRAPRKLYTWPAYRAEIRARDEVPACVLVVSQDEDVARWAAEPIELGPGETSRVHALGPSTIPRVTDAAEARSRPSLALLSALVHGDGPGGGEILRAAGAALAMLDQDAARTFAAALYNALGPVAQDALEVVMETELPPKLAKAIAGQFIAEAEARGEARGRLVAKRDTLLRLLSVVGLETSAAEHARIVAASEVELDLWIARAVRARSAAELFGPR